MYAAVLSTGSSICLVPRRLSLDENWLAKEGEKEKTGKTALKLPSLPFPWSLARRRQSLASFRNHAKNVASEEEAVLTRFRQ